MKPLTRILVFTSVFILHQWMPALAQSTQTYKAQWADQSSNEKGFKLYAMGGTIAQWQLKCQVPANTKECGFTESDAIPRCYAVVAFNDAGDSIPTGPSCIGAPSGPGSFTVIQTTPPLPIPPG